MLGSLIGGGLKLAGAIAGGIANARAAKKIKKQLNQQAADNKAWYDRRYNEDGTQRADAQRALAMTEQSIRNRNKNAAGTSAVMGGTDASAAASKAANNQALTSTMTNIAVNADKRKDNIENQYLTNKKAIEDKKMGITQQTAQNTAQAVQTMVDIGSGIAEDQLNKKNL